MEELENEGYQWLYNYCLFKLGNGQDLVLDAYSRKSNFGFYYIEGFGIPPKKEDRQTVTQKNGSDYKLCEETTTGKPNFIPIKSFPSNIFILNQKCYWYQDSGDNEKNKKLVTKDIAIKILRQDIKAYLAKAPKSTK